MKLSRLISEHFTDDQKELGSIVYEDAPIYLGRFDGTKALITVDDRPPQTLMIRRVSSSQVIIHCSCRGYSMAGNCCHIWATVLRIEREDRADLADVILQAHGKSQRSDWKHVIKEIQQEQENELFHQPPSALKNRPGSFRIVYVIRTGHPPRHEQTGLDLKLYCQTKNKQDQWTAPKPFEPGRNTVGELGDTLDQTLLQFLLGAQSISHMPVSTSGEFELERNWRPELVEALANSGRLYWSAGSRFSIDDAVKVTRSSFDRFFEICVEVAELDAEEGTATFSAFIVEKSAHGDAAENQEASIQSPDLGRIDNDEVIALARDGVLLTKEGLYRVTNPDARPVWEACQANPETVIEKSDRDRFLEKLSSLAGIEDVRLPETWQVTEPITIQPRGELRLSKNEYQKNFYAEVFIRYDDVRYHFSDRRLSTFDAASSRWLKRNTVAEEQLVGMIESLPVAFEKGDALVSWDFKFAETVLMDVLDYLASSGWDVLLQGQGIHSPSTVSIAVESGKDWFDVSADVKFEGQTIALPEILAAIKAKEHFVKLADGSRGRLPDHLVAQYTQLAMLGKSHGDKIRFQPTQAMLLDALLEQQKDVRLDAGFKKTRKQLSAFQGVKAKTPPRSFKGTLRSYQEEGLGWLHFLKDFGFGGCLADDMGLGKTIQVLALLESRRTRRTPQDQAVLVSSGKEELVEVDQSIRFVVDEVSAGLASSKKNANPHGAITAAAMRCKRRPSIVVVPKSLVFNWIDEAQKFTSKLKVFNYTGADRESRLKESDGFDVLITTYATMRRDIAGLSRVHFDYAILDESQAIKNSAAQVAKAARLLVADHRLAMTGTPIENHLGELWSMFNFLNPGMLGMSSKFEKLTRVSKSSRKERKIVIESLSKAISPFVLRRTKDQVLKDLPAKTEQTLFCDMTPNQKLKYEEAKHYYQVKLKNKVQTQGLGKAKIHVLEALLRLRQIACDPRLVDGAQKPGAKLELLQQQIAEVVAEGHKVLVFSQFTTLLGLVQKQFDSASIRYEYLDGQTQNRQARVKSFQEDPSVSAFLISLKAGGHGLNLTAADYVFLLDPWWNPAVEAQAIDRAHRMGQQRPVIAYRMICRGTVEEKILELQQSKRALADSIIQADESLMRTMTGDDIRMLLE